MPILITPILMPLAATAALMQPLAPAPDLAPSITRVMGARQAETPEAGQCPAGSFQTLVGKSPDEARNIPDPKRVLAYDAIITMEYIGTRTTVRLGQDGLIDSIVCG